MGGWRRWSIAAAIAGVAWISTSAPAAADAVTVGDCVGEGTWQDGGFSESSADHEPGDTIDVPRADTVAWTGSVGGFDPSAPEGPQREIEGEIELVLPSKTTVVIDDWGPNDSVRYANTGEHDYDLPSVLIGIRMRLQGEHRENGEVVCTGNVRVRIEGSALSNPLAYVGLAGMALSGAVLVFAGRPVFQNVTPGGGNPG